MTTPHPFRVVECPRWNLEAFINTASEAGYRLHAASDLSATPMALVVLLDQRSAKEREREPELELPRTGIA